MTFILSILAQVLTLCCVDERNQKAVEYVGTRPTGGGVQLELLQKEGLQPDDYVLEVGCGALLSAIPIMSFLEKEHYVGIDPNSWLREQTVLIAENRMVIEASKPLFLQRSDFDAQSTGIVFDFIFAHSIMSHAAHWQLPLFLENSAKVLKEGGKVIFSLRLTQPNEYGNEGADQETRANEWQYPGCSFFDEETVIREAGKWFHKVERKKEFTTLITSDDRSAFHDWFVLTK
jgi:cyclopropane fatty-acyl-phospholipid synthase-like methyltransferase